MVEQTDDGGGVSKTDSQSLSDFDKHFHLRGNLLCMIAPVKIRMHPTNANEVLHGLIFEVIKVLVKLPLERFSKANSDEHETYFLDSASD